MLLVTALSTLCVESISAQNHKERKVVREGNEAFKAGEYRQSLDLYNEALDIAPDCMEATYNRANAYHHVMRTNDGRDSTITWQQSNKYYEDMLVDERLSDAQRAEVLRNVGESLMTQQEYEAALNAFRESLLLNSDDAETKYNYVLAKRIVDQMRQQNNQNQDNQNNQQQNQNQNQDQNQDQDQQKNDDQQKGDDNKEGDNKENDKEQPKGGDDQQKGDDDQQKGDNKQDGNEKQDDNTPPESEGGKQPKGLSDEQERLLDAIQGEEDKTQEKLDEGAAAVYAPGKKNW
jgi:tetratricopeptide (TPR) repeat protein